MSLTWGELKTELQTILVNTGTTFVASNDEIVLRAERRIYRATRVPDGRQVTSASFTASQATISAPAGMLYPRYMKVAVSGVDQPMYFRDPSFIREVWPNASTAGVPRYAATQQTEADFDHEILVAPTPADTYTYTLGWYGYGTSIVDTGDDTQTSYLGQYVEGLLLAAAVLEGAIWMKIQGPLLETYKGEYDMEMAVFKQIAEAQTDVDEYEPAR